MRYDINKQILPTDMNDKLVEIMKTWDIVAKSPYSNSFYDTNGKSWEHTPENSFRISDHWNFGNEYDKIVHCPTNKPVKSGYWTLAQYRNGVYVVIKSYKKTTKMQKHTKDFIANIQEAVDNEDIYELMTIFNSKYKRTANKYIRDVKKNGIFEINKDDLFVGRKMLKTIHPFTYVALNRNYYDERVSNIFIN